jgi:hypothetical protein
MYRMYCTSGVSQSGSNLSSKLSCDSTTRAFPLQSLSTNESSDVHSQNNVEPLSEIIDTRTTSEAPETVETSGEDHIPVIISNRQSESREPSQESVSANEGSNVENNTKEVSVEKVEIPSETVNTNSEEAVIHVDENKQKPTVKSEETVSEQEVLKDSSVDLGLQYYCIIYSNFLKTKNKDL